MQPTLMAILVWSGVHAGAAPTLEERLKTVTAVGHSPLGAPVDDRVPVAVVEASRVSFATDSRAVTALSEDEIPTSPPGPSVMDRLNQSGFPQRLKGAARGGNKRLSMVIDSRARTELVMAAVKSATEAGLTVQLVDVSARPWKRWFTVGLTECHDGSVKDCLGESGECVPNVCAQLAFSPSAAGTLASATRRLIDDNGACLEKQRDATPAAPAAWDGLLLKGEKDRCPPFKDLTTENLKSWHALITPHVPVCEAVTLQLSGSESMDRVGTMLDVLNGQGATVLQLDPTPTSTCENAVPLSALDAKPTAVTVEAERVTGGLKQNAVMGVLRAQRAALTSCVTQVRMKDPSAGGTFKAGFRVTDAGAVAMLKWDSPPPDALKSCFEKALKGATFDRAARSSEVRISISSER